MTEPNYNDHREHMVRGLQVLRLAACGLSDIEIGTQLHLAKDSVKSRLRALYALIGAVNRPHAVAIAIYKGWISEGDLLKVAETRHFRPTRSRAKRPTTEN